LFNENRTEASNGAKRVLFFGKLWKSLGENRKP